MRVDKYLWAIRIYKTRTIASEACASGKVWINKAQAKPSKPVSQGDIIDVRKGPVTYSYKVIEAIGKRVGAKLVENYVKDITSAEELEKLEAMKQNQHGTRDRGEGRPTKRDRRLIDKFFGE